MRLSLVCCVALVTGCAYQIGDSCIQSSDCQSDGSRICDTSQHDGYCTITGCDYDTCPEEAVCVRFFSGGFANKPCGTQADCSLDELCSLQAECVSRSSETRFCMKKCGSTSDCRDGYECRDFDLMKTHGGEAVLAPGEVVDASSSPAFCAVAPG